MKYLRLLINLRPVAIVALVLGFIAAGDVAVTPSVAAVAGSYTFAVYTADFAGGNQVRHIWWNNANDNDAYAVGLEGTNVERTCRLRVKRTWYQRNPSGEREFHMEIEGDPSYQCRVTVYLTAVGAFRTQPTGGLRPGQSKAWFWNNAHTERYVYFVGVTPQVTTEPCAIEVTSRYRTEPSGENRFFYQATNVGSIACSADLKHVQVDVAYTPGRLIFTSSPGGLLYNVFDLLRASITSKVFVAGAVPDANAGGPCEFAPQPVTYSGPDWGDIVGTDYLNTGAVRCSLKPTLAVP